MESLRQLSEDSSGTDIVFNDVYELGGVINRGRYSGIFCCMHRSTGQMFAVKIVNLDKYNAITGLNLEDIKTEANIGHSLKHQHIVELLETYCSDGLVYMVFEYMDGKDLFSEIIHRVSIGFAYSESVASHYMRQILEAVCHCHAIDIVHRHLSPQCLLLSSNHNSAPLKVTGFSRASRITGRRLISGGHGGSRHFIAPEMLARQYYGKPVDVWSCGAILHTLLTGAPPTICNAIDTGSPILADISESARDLIRHMLTSDPVQRVTAAEALNHAWIKERGCGSSDLHLAAAVGRLCTHNTYRRLARAASAAICCDLWPRPGDVWSSHTGPTTTTVSTTNRHKVEDLTLIGAQQITNTMDDIQMLLLSNDSASIRKLLSNSQFQQLLKLLDIISAHRSSLSSVPSAGALLCFRDVQHQLQNTAQSAAATSLTAITGGTAGTADTSSSAAVVALQLQDLASRPHFQALLQTHEVLCDHLFGERPVGVSPPPPLEPSISGPPNGMAGSNHVTRVRLVQFQKSTDEPMGITLKMSDDGRCLVARIMHGGMIHRQATLHVGDEIREINGVPVLNQNVDALQRILRDSRGSVTFKIVPSQQVTPEGSEASSQIYLRAQFDYDPLQDNLIPCAQAGIEFRTGDILQIISREDHHWWQARRQESPTLAGLIPSPELQEHRAASTAADRAKQQQVHCSIFGKRKRMFKEKNSAKSQSLFENLELNTYEEVVRMKTFRRKTLVLLGAHGVGRRHIKNSLISSYPDKFAYPIPHTTRPPRQDEEEGKQYHFVSHDQMMSDIASNQYLEYGTHEDAMYGTKLDTIRRIQLGGRVAILDVEPQALRVLRCAEHAPYVVFIAAPTLQLTTDYDGSLERLGRESEVLQRAYGHYFDLTIVNNDINTTISQLEEEMIGLDNKAQWVPVAWVY